MVMLCVPVPNCIYLLNTRVRYAVKLKIAESSYAQAKLELKEQNNITLLYSGWVEILNGFKINRMKHT